MDLDTALTKLREKVAAPNFIVHLINKWLLNNKHRVRLTFRPDLQFAEEQKAILKKVEALMEKYIRLESEIIKREQYVKTLTQLVLKEAFEARILRRKV